MRLPCFCTLINNFLFNKLKWQLTRVVCAICTNLLWVPQVKEVQVTLVTHLFVCREHDDVAAEIEAARSDSRVGVEQGQLFACAAQRDRGTGQ